MPRALGVGVAPGVGTLGCLQDSQIIAIVKRQVAAMTWKEGPRPITQSLHAHASCRVDIGMRCCPISRSSCFACFVCKWCLMLVVVCCGVVLMLACDVAKRAVTPCRHCLDMPFAHFVCKCVWCSWWCVGMFWYGCLVMLSTVGGQSPHARCFLFLQVFC